MSYLLDVNVLVALVWPNHVQHEAAHNWFGAARNDGWATCGLTQSGFVRISANAAVFDEALTPRQGTELIGDWTTGDRRHEYWNELPPIHEMQPFGRDVVHGHRQVTDAYLVGLCELHTARLATFDRRLSAYGDVVALLPSDR